jgi:hypothetical protein
MQWVARLLAGVNHPEDQGRFTILATSTQPAVAWCANCCPLWFLGEPRLQAVTLSSDFFA